MSYGTLNPWFNFYTCVEEQDFYADFIDEEIRISGTECLYIPKEMGSVDSILGEPYQSLYQQFFPIPARLMTPLGYDGQPDVMTQFGVQFQPTSEWVISKRMFRAMNIPNRQLRPNEGDLLLVGNYQSTDNDPIFTSSLFEMTYVKRDSPNWPLGRYYVWAINCELYAVDGEKFETGNPHIDRINTQYGPQASLDAGINSGLEKKIADLVDFTEDNPFSGL